MTIFEPEPAPPQVARTVVPPGSFWGGFVRGWRPFGGWVCVLILLTRGVAIPVVQLIRGEAVEPLDWVALISLVGMLGLSRERNKERMAGVTG